MAKNVLNMLLFADGKAVGEECELRFAMQQLGGKKMLRVVDFHASAGPNPRLQAVANGLKRLLAEAKEHYPGHLLRVEVHAPAEVKAALERTPPGCAALKNEIENALWGAFEYGVVATDPAELSAWLIP